MGARGRKSAASAVIVTGSFGTRPQPPANLTTAQRTIWRQVVASEEPAFFGTAVTRALLADYCRRRSTGDQLTAVIDQLDPARHDLDKLLKMRDREQAAVVMLARSLRLTNQSRYNEKRSATAAKHAPTGPVPWKNARHLTGKPDTA